MPHLHDIGVIEQCDFLPCVAFKAAERMGLAQAKSFCKILQGPHRITVAAGIGRFNDHNGVSVHLPQHIGNRAQLLTALYHVAAGPLVVIQQHIMAAKQVGKPFYIISSNAQVGAVIFWLRLARAGARHEHSPTLR